MVTFESALVRKHLNPWVLKLQATEDNNKNENILSHKYATILNATVGQLLIIVSVEVTNLFVPFRYFSFI